jgi:hypothetical protein
MSKNTKQIINYVAAIIFIIIVPVLLVPYFIKDNDEVFYERLKEDHETCYQRAKQDAVDTRWCNEIRDAAKLAYYESSRRDNSSFLLILLAPLFFVLIYTVGNLKKEVNELKEKINA